MKSKLSLLVGLFFFASAAPLAHAATVTVPFQYDYFGTGYMETFYNVYQANLNKEVYTPGEMINVAASVVSEPFGYGWYVSAFQDRCGGESGYLDTFIVGKATDSGYLSNYCGFNRGWEGGANGPIRPFNLLWAYPFYAEQTPTTNSMLVYVTTPDGSLASISLPYCVSTTGSCQGGPKGCVQNKGQACSSAPNSCGETTTGTIACDGSCTAVTPVNTCPNPGQGVTSSVTVTISKQKPGINLFFTSP